MELRQLKYFAEVARTLNFSEAAKALYVTQSTLSQQIRQLEQELGAPLFYRNSHSVSLTEVGSNLLPHALRTLYEAGTCKDRVQDLMQLQTGELNIGVTFTFSPILTETLLAFMKEYPRVKLNIFYKTTSELMDMLKNRTVDFVLAFRLSDVGDEIESHILFDDHLSAIVSSDHSLAALPSVTPEELSQYEVALPAQGLQSRNAFDSIDSSLRKKFRVRIELNEVNILLKIIKQSSLVTILSEATTYSEPGVKAVPIDFSGNGMEGCVHILKDGYRKSSSLEFIRMLSESNAVRQRQRKWLRSAT